MCQRFRTNKWLIPHIEAFLWASFNVNLRYARVILEEKNSVLKNTTTRSACGQAYDAIFFTDNWHERAQMIVSGAIFGLVVLVAIRKQAEQPEGANL